MSEAKADTVPGLGFKDKEKANETIKNLEGRDPDYQKLAIKGLIGRAKRTLTLTKDSEKLKNINEALSIFDEWLKNFENKGLSKQNRSYLPLDTIKTLLPLKDQYKISDSKSDAFLKAYKNASGEYKNLRTVASGQDEPSWDIVRNSALKKLLENVDKNDVDLWKDDLPTKEHVELILWAYSPDASKIKKNLSRIAEKIGGDNDDDSESEKSEEESEEEQPKEKKDKTSNKRKSDEGSSSSSKKNRK